MGNGKAGQHLSEMQTKGFQKWLRKSLISLDISLSQGYNCAQHVQHRRYFLAPYLSSPTSPGGRLRYLETPEPIHLQEKLSAKAESFFIKSRKG
ncbi:MAG: hypothetical protein ABFD14_11970 [Anaerolineaceae bacterium]